jgi:hypothetical protein
MPARKSGSFVSAAAPKKRRRARFGPPVPVREKPTPPDVATNATATSEPWALRNLAGLHYVQDLGRCSLDALNQVSMFATVPRRTLERWCAVDRWVERRADFWKNVEQVVVHSLATELVDARRAELDDLSQLRADVLRRIHGKSAAAKSFEGLCRVLIELGRRVDEVKDGMSELVKARAAASAVRPVGLAAKLTPQEARAAAMAIIHHRRDEMRRHNAALEEQDASDATGVDGNVAAN